MARKSSLSGHVVSKKGISVDPTKVDTINNWPQPTNVTEVRSFLGMVRYYRILMEDFSIIALPITCLICKSTKFEWTNEYENSFRD